MMRIAMTFTLFCLLAACSDKKHSAMPVTQPQSMVVTAAMPVAASAVAPTLPQQLTELEKHEPDEIAKSENLVERKGKILSLRLLSGQMLNLTNLETCDVYENCLFYTYRGLVRSEE